MEKIALTPDQVEELYHIPKQTLANWRSKKVGPDFFLVYSTTTSCSKPISSHLS